MLAVGIVAEYNPFHNGHKYLIEQARLAGATHIAVVMSGAAVQRGSVAVYDKFFRAKTAIKNGADLVLELPCPYSCSNGEAFASAAIGILASAGEGVISRLCFGSEIADAPLLKKAAKASAELKDSSLVREKLADGKSYPAAVAESAKEEYGEEVCRILSNPNSTLAVEYIKSAERLAPWLEIQPVLRRSAGHHDTDIHGEIASATAIREIVRNDGDLTRLVPWDSPSQPCFLENMDKEILYRLSCADKEQLLSLPDVNSDIADVFLREGKALHGSVEEFLRRCKSKNIIMARLRRAVLHLTLGVKREDIQQPPYARILAFDRRGAELLGRWGDALPIDTSLARLEKTSAHALRVSQLEQNASRLQYLCGRVQERYISEYSRKISITETE